MRRLAWVLTVSSRWFSHKREGGGLGFALAAIGIGIGVATLIVVLGVMNGFQLSYVDSVLQVSSFHARIEMQEETDTADSLVAEIRTLPGVASVLPFRETYVLLAATDGRTMPIKLRVLPEAAPNLDPAFIQRLNLAETERAGLPSEGLLVGEELARYLGLSVGDRISLVFVQADEVEGLEMPRFKTHLAGTFRSGYYDFDFGMGIIAAESVAAASLKGRSSPLVLGVKLENRNQDDQFVLDATALMRERGVNDGTIASWRQYNRAFFGALRTEKGVMMLLVGLIFIVVGVNIYHAMRRTVTERLEDIAVLRAIGAGAPELRLTFILDGLAVGLWGAVGGLLAGLLIAVNVNEVFGLVETMINSLSRLVSFLGLGGSDFRVFSPEYFYLMEVPVRVLFPETLFIVSSAILSAAIAAGAAASRISSLQPAEVLRYE